MDTLTKNQTKQLFIIDHNGFLVYKNILRNTVPSPLDFKLKTKHFRSFFATLLDSDDFKKLNHSIEHILSGGSKEQFHLILQRPEDERPSLDLTGMLFSYQVETPHCLIIYEETSEWFEEKDIISSMTKELETIKLDQGKKLIAATASLIETNVDLRKEIRERQITLLALKESETRFRDLADTTSDFIWEIDCAGKYTYASPKIFALLGLRPKDLLDTNFLFLRAAGNSCQQIEDIPFNEGSDYSFSKLEYIFKHVKGHKVTIESSGEPIFSKHDKLIGYRGIDRDITERRFYENKLKKAKELAESANLAKSEFLANMSHELRTPLHAILSFAKYGIKKIDSAERTKLLQYFKQIDSSGERLMPMINSLLDLAKLEAGKMSYDFQSRDLAIEIRAIMHEMRPLAEKKGLTLKIVPSEVESFALFDQDRLGQVIRNILSNSINFSYEYTVIEILFRKTKVKDTLFLQTTISNFGIEIPKNELHSIFNKFAQSSKTKTGAGGTGLGLSICKKIIEDHQGTVWAAHGDNGATEFHFTLPLTMRPKKIGQILINRGLLTKEELELALKDQ